MAAAAKSYDNVDCTCTYGFRTNPSLHSDGCAWARAWADYWDGYTTKRGQTVAEARREIFTEAYNKQREDESA